MFHPAASAGDHILKAVDIGRRKLEGVVNKEYSATVKAFAEAEAGDQIIKMRGRMRSSLLPRSGWIGSLSQNSMI